MNFALVFDHLPVNASFVWTERADNGRLRVSGLDMTPQVAPIGGFKPTVLTDKPDSFVFNGFV